MKALLFFALFPLTSSALEISEVQVTRMMGGENVLCRETYEIGRESNFAEFVSATVSEQAITFALQVKFLICAGSREERHWENRLPLDPIPLVNSIYQPAHIELRDPEFVVSTSDSIGLSVADVANEQEQVVNLRYPLASGLSAAEKAALEAGRPVQMRAHILYRAIAKAVDSRGETPLGTRFGAAYSVSFVLQNK